MISTANAHLEECIMASVGLTTEISLAGMAVPPQLWDSNRDVATGRLYEQLTGSHVCRQSAVATAAASPTNRMGDLNLLLLTPCPSSCPTAHSDCTRIICVGELFVVEGCLGGPGGNVTSLWFEAYHSIRGRRCIAPLQIFHYLQA